MLGVMALEISGGDVPTVAALPPSRASALAERLGQDLARLVPQAAQLDLSLAAAHFDPAEALRPGWPLHQRLQELRQRAPGDRTEARIIAFGADEEGEVPLPFRADTALAGGALRVLPFVLSGPAEVVKAVGDTFEDILLETGMAGADTALLAQQAFGARVEHARYLTAHDLAAMMAMQYRNSGLEALWPIIETALVAPGEAAWLDAPPEPLLRYDGAGQAFIALFEPAAWRARYAPELGDEDRLDRAYQYFQTRQQQLAAVLQAHGIEITFAHCPGSADPRQALVD